MGLQIDIDQSWDMAQLRPLSIQHRDFFHYTDRRGCPLRFNSYVKRSRLVSKRSIPLPWGLNQLRTYQDSFHRTYQGGSLSSSDLSFKQTEGLLLSVKPDQDEATDRDLWCKLIICKWTMYRISSGACRCRHYYGWSPYFVRISCSSLRSFSTWPSTTCPSFSKRCILRFTWTIMLHNQHLVQTQSRWISCFAWWYSCCWSIPPKVTSYWENCNIGAAHLSLKTIRVPSKSFNILWSTGPWWFWDNPSLYLLLCQL